MKEICSIIGCSKVPRTRKMCSMHYARYHRHGNPHTALVLLNPSAKQLKELFWSRVRKTESCWLWQGTIQHGGGYGVFYAKGYAHRFSYEIHKGKIPDSLHVLHRCDNPPCVNPAHLFVGTHQDNRNDSVSKKRHSFGEKCYRSKLTRANVLFIRRACLEGESQTVLARQFGIVPSAISHIVRGKNWRLV